LTLDNAVQLAVKGNRTLQIAGLEVDKSRLEVAETKTKRLPAFNTYVFGSELLTPVNFIFPAGSFGTFKGIGPIPAVDTSISTGNQFTAYVAAQAAQPLSQLYEIHLAIREKELSTDQASEKYRGTRNTVVHDVKQAYYAVLQTQSSVEATQASIKQYEELNRVVSERLAQEAVLLSDSLDAQTKLAQERYQLLQMTNQLEDRKEHLNDLLGRDLSTPFRTQDVPGVSAEESDLKYAQQTALVKRPEVKQAEITVEQADYERRLAKAQYIPSVGVAVHYLSNFNVTLLPENVASAGVEFSWEPFDWGRRKDQVSEKKIAVTQSQLQLDQTKSQVLLDVNNHFRKVQESRVLVDVTKSAREAANEKLREITQKYGQKTVLFRDVLQQQAAVASANNDYEEAVLSFWNSKADLEKAIGEE
jgi:outer membrane protein TolC